MGVESAKQGQKVWAAMTAMERSRILRRAVDIYENVTTNWLTSKPLIRANRFLKLVMWISLQGRMFLNTMQV